MASSHREMKRTDTALLGLLPRARAERLHAARVVVAAYCEPGGIATVESVARTTGFSVAMVRLILSSDDWDELVAAQILNQVSPIISKGAALLASIINDEDESKHARMQAHRLALQTYDIIMKNRPKHRDANNDEAFDEFLNQIPNADAKVRDDLAGIPPTVLP